MLVGKKTLTEMTKLFIVLLAVSDAFKVNIRRSSDGEANSPISKVLDLLTQLQGKVAQDSAVEEKQFQKFTEWCEDETTSKQYEIKNGKAKAEVLAATIEKESSNIGVADATIQELAATVTSNRGDLDAATKIRESESADFDKADAELGDTVDQIGRAIAILNRYLKDGTALVQTGKGAKKGAKTVLKKAAIKEVLDALALVVQATACNADDKEKLTSLLQASDDDDFLTKSAPEASAYESHSGAILDTLEDMKDKAEELRADGQKGEMNAKHAYQMLKQSSENALKVDGKDFDAAKQAKSVATEAKAMAEGDLSMTAKMLAEAEKFLEHVTGECQQKASDFAQSKESRADELKALQAAKEMIEQKTGAAASRSYDFVQVRTGGVERTEAAAKLISKLGRKTKDMAMNQLAIRIDAAVQMGSNMSSGDDVFAKVRTMIEEMVAKLMADAAQEADHKAWCDNEMGETQTKVEGHNRKIEKLGADIDATAAGIAKLTEHNAETQEALSQLAHQQAEMNKLRADEKAAAEQAVTDYEAGIDGLSMALKIVREYYATEAETPAFVQQPTVGTHSKANDAATGIIGLLEVAESDFSKMLADVKVQEEAAQRAYDEQSHQNDVDRAMKEADVKYETKEKADLESSLNDLKVDKTGEQDELNAVGEYFKRLAPACTTKSMSYEERKTRRESEITGLREALQILEGPGAEAFLAVRTTRK